MNFLAALPAHIAQNLQILKQVLAKHTSRAYLVGGCVRDILRGVEVQDADVEVYDVPPKLFETLMENLGAKGVGKSFFVYKWNGIDIALARQENKTSIGHKGFEVKLCQDERIASSRRDFTCNALMVGLFDGKLKDFWGGIKDINSLQLRHIDEQKFSEDSLRVLRGVQFAARFGFRISEETLQIMRKLDLRELSQTRITWELEKLFMGDFYAHGVYAMCQLDLFEKVFNVTISPSQAWAFSKKLLRYKKNIPLTLKPYYWLFFFLEQTKVDPKRLLAKLSLGKTYERMLLHVPFGSPDMSDYELMKIAKDRPLNSWVGICYPKVAQRAKKLGIDTKTFDGGVDVQEVILDGFCGKNIGIELRKRILQKAKEKSNNQE